MAPPYLQAIRIGIGLLSHKYSVKTTFKIGHTIDGVLGPVGRFNHRWRLHTFRQLGEDRNRLTNPLG